jgi:hypothetical protein
MRQSATNSMNGAPRDVGIGAFGAPLPSAGRLVWRVRVALKTSSLTAKFFLGRAVSPLPCEPPHGLYQCGL